MAEVTRRRETRSRREASIQTRYEALRPTLSERMRRLWAAAEAKAAGPGSISLVSRATGICRETIARGCNELNDPTLQPSGQRIRHQGAGATPLTQKDSTLVSDLEQWIEPTTRGDPESPLRWTCKSTRNLEDALRQKGHKVSRSTIRRVLRSLDYSLQANRKILEGADHPDRDEQFSHINDTVKSFQQRGQPAISVDTQKKELVGNYKNGGREWEPAGQPVPVNTNDFPDPLRGKVAPYGVLDTADNSGWVSVGIDHDTAAFAVETLRRWWNTMGQPKYADAKELLITADGGGSNGARVRLWKVELQKLADETGLHISVCHFPPGTSKWNQIEHRMFSFITKNWRGRPFTDYMTIVQLIGATQTKTGLTVRCDLDANRYPKGIKVTDEEMATLHITRHSFHGEWNYTLAPRPRAK